MLDLSPGDVSSSSLFGNLFWGLRLEMLSEQQKHLLDTIADLKKKKQSKNDNWFGWGRGYSWEVG